MSRSSYREYVQELIPNTQLSPATKAYRDKRSDNRPRPHITCNPNYTVRYVFDKATFTTQIEADSSEDALKKAYINFMFTYYTRRDRMKLGRLIDKQVFKGRERV